MSKTIRVRDEDAHRIELISELTGLPNAEAAHYLFEPVSDLRTEMYHARRALERYLIYSEPEIENRDDITDALLRQASLNNAGEMLPATHGDRDPVTLEDVLEGFDVEPEELPETDGSPFDSHADP